MRLLLTRAAEDAARTREKLAAMGHGVIVSPLIEIVGTGASWPDGVADAVLATSAQAFRFELDGLLPEARHLLPLYLVGSRTQDAARDAGFLGAAHVEKNAAALAALMGESAIGQRRLVYLAGRDRKPDIETALAEMGWSLDVIEIYEARPVESLGPDAMRALEQKTIEGILHFSRRSAALFVAAAKKAGLETGRPTHFCLSEDVAGPLREAGCSKIEIAASPNEADLLARVGSV